MVKRVLALLVVAALVGGALWVRNVLGDGDGLAGALGGEEGDAVEIDVVCDEEIAGFCDEAVASFLSESPEVEGGAVDVNLEFMPSAEAQVAIAEGTIDPLVWIPSSTAWVDQANTAHRAATGSDLYLKSGQYQILSIAQSPMVFVVQSDRAAVLSEFCGGDPDWQCIYDAANDARGWVGLGGDAAWGLVKFKHASPLTTNSGLLSLALMFYGYHGKQVDLTPADVVDPGARDFVLELEATIDTFPKSPSQFDQNLVTLGGSNYDIASTYEYTAAEAARNAPGKGFDLDVLYPPVTITSDFPYAIRVDRSSTAVEKDAALVLRDHFYGDEVQRSALRYGLRPANPDVPIADPAVLAVAGDGAAPGECTVGEAAEGTDPENLLVSQVCNGVRLRIPRTETADFPSAETVAELQRLWRQEVNR